MINVSNEFKSLVKDARDFIVTVEITLADSTVITVDDTKIRSIEIDDLVTQTDKFTIGGALINELTVVIDNLDDAYSGYNFEGAVLRPTIGLQLSETIETLNKGVFTADEFKSANSTITIIALDNMDKFDRPFKDVTQAFPCTAYQLLSSVCTNCGVFLSTTDFTNDDFTIQARPLDDAVTCREIVSWIAQLAGCFARCNTSGALELKWYDFEVFEEEEHYNGGSFDGSMPYSTGDTLDGGTFAFNDGDTVNGGDFVTQNRYHHIYSLNSMVVATDDVVITGIQVTDGTEVANKHLFGVIGYLISIENNKLIQSSTDAETITDSVGAKIVGMKFRPMSVQAVSDPSREAGDVAYVSDRKGNVYQTLISHVTFSIGQYDKITCDAETPLRNSSVRYSASTKTIIEARKTVEIKLTAYDLMVQQLNNLVAHSFGVYKTEEVLEDGSTIYYLHDKPTLAESLKVWKQTADAFAISTDGGVTYTAGFDAEGNAVFNILSAIGINADWVKTGKLLSNDGATLIDMAYGVANSDNISFMDSIQAGFPLTMPFNIDASVSKINSVLLKYLEFPFRTHSTTASSGGGSSTTSSSGGGFDNFTMPNGGVSASSNTSEYNGVYSGETGSADGTVGSHKHSMMVLSHLHTVYHPAISDHSHRIILSNHTHSVDVPAHTHGLNMGIQEQAISDYAIGVYVDNVLRVSITNDIANIQGIIDLTEWITTTGWHTIELRSTTLKRISAQINIKSYIRS